MKAKAHSEYFIQKPRMGNYWETRQQLWIQAHSYSFLSWYLVLICIHIDLDSRMIFKDTRTHILLAFCNDNKSRREQYDLTSTNRKRIISYSFLPYRTQSRHRRTTEYQQGFWEGISQVPFLLQTMPLLACSSSQRWINFIWSYI